MRIAVEHVDPLCPHCGLQLERPAYEEIFPIHRPHYHPVRCECGWTGMAQFYKPQPNPAQELELRTNTKHQVTRGR